MNFGIKKLDQLIIKSFIGPFIITFFIVLFVLLMQFFWLYMDDMMGKGLGLNVILELMMYMASTLVPMALPLGILLASIMTFGTLGENFELVAIKSSGISLFRFMRPLTVTIFILTIVAFLFSNFVIPKANIKAFSLLYDIRKSKPTMNFKPGVFNKDLGNFVIRIGTKGEDGESIQDILIYDHSSGQGNNNVIIADSGRMYLSKDSRYMIFELRKGWRYEETVNNQGQREQQRMYFGTWNKVIDLSELTAFSRTGEDGFKNKQEMLNVAQLDNGVDSFHNQIDVETKMLMRNVRPYLSILPDNKGVLDTALFERIKSEKATVTYKDNLLELFNDSTKNSLNGRVGSALMSTQRFAEIAFSGVKIKEDTINRYKMEWHKKFTFSFACMLLFLIGAPLGAIIRKGGIGMPVVVAVGFFVIYFVISNTGEKLARQQELSPFFGMWLSTLVLLPVAAFIMVQARNDSNIFNKETYLRIWKKIIAPFKKKAKS